MTTAEIIALVSVAVTLAGIIVSYLVTIDKVMNGQRCRHPRKTHTTLQSQPSTRRSCKYNI